MNKNIIKEDDNEILKTGYRCLNDFQKDILNECISLRTGGMSLPMGTGKTLISIVLGLILQRYSNKAFLIVCSKSLLSSWELEIKKFFSSHCNFYKIWTTTSTDFSITDDIKFVITTPETIHKFYKDNNISEHFIFHENRSMISRHNHQQQIVQIVSYKNIRTPISKVATFYDYHWSSIMIDEIQKYTNIETSRTRAIASVCATYRWGLSGTIFDEPKPVKILGYYVLLGLHGIMGPINVPDMNDYIRSSNFRGLRSLIVHRDKNIEFNEPIINNNFISHEFTQEEADIYMAIKNIIRKIRLKLDANRGNVDTTRKFSSYLLAVINYLRQCLICPIAPLSSVFVDITDITNKSELSSMLKEEIDKLNLLEWLNSTRALESSRIKKIREILNHHKDEKVVVFSCFRTSVDMIMNFIEKDGRPVFTLRSQSSAKARGQEIEKFRESENGVLVMTYDIGAEGLNLQFAHTVLITDFWWNCSKTKQAISRILRFGQENSCVNVYVFSSNTGIEKALFRKQYEKLLVCSELMDGNQKTNIAPITVKEILKFIDMNDNIKIIEKIV